MSDPSAVPWQEFPVSQRDALVASQPTLLATTGHRSTEALCYAAEVSALDPSETVLCGHGAAFVIERYNYRNGVTMSDVFRPAKIITQVCSAHMAVLISEAGFIGYEWLPDDSGSLVDVLERFFHRHNEP